MSGDYFLRHRVFHTKSAGPLRRRDSDHDFSAVDCRNSHHGDLRMFIFLHNERLWERQQPSGVVLGWVLIQSALLTKWYGFNSCIRGQGRGSAMHVLVFWLRGKVICPMKTYMEVNVSASFFFTPCTSSLGKLVAYRISKISHYPSQTITMHRMNSYG